MATSRTSSKAWRRALPASSWTRSRIWSWRLSTRSWKRWSTARRCAKEVRAQAAWASRARATAVERSSGVDRGTSPSGCPVKGCSTAMLSRSPPVSTRPASARSWSAVMRLEGRVDVDGGAVVAVMAPILTRSGASGGRGGHEVDPALGGLAHDPQLLELALELRGRVAVDVGALAHLRAVPQRTALVDPLQPGHAVEGEGDEEDDPLGSPLALGRGAPRVGDPGAADERALERPAIADATQGPVELPPVQPLPRVDCAERPAGRQSAKSPASCGPTQATASRSSTVRAASTTSS